jgi:RNA polymerase sigma factor (sigma-70 family)
MRRLAQKAGNKKRSQDSYLQAPMRGDLDFDHLVDEHHAPLYRFALSLCRNEAEAADLVQETFYLWAAKGHQLENAARVKGWLFTTLHREFLGKRRRLVRFPHHELGEVEGELPEVPPELPTRLDWEVLSECLQQMDPTFHAPVALFYLEDYSYNEIAEILEVPLGTVKSRIARGIAQLQKMIHQHTPSKGLSQSRTT